jgi:hypothetical protein
VEVPSKRQGLHVREIEGETVVLDPRGERMHNLNATAAFIFHEVDGVRTVEEICEAVADAFDVPAPTAEKDTRALLAELARLGIIA